MKGGGWGSVWGEMDGDASSALWFSAASSWGVLPRTSSMRGALGFSHAGFLPSSFAGSESCACRGENRHSNTQNQAADSRTGLTLTGKDVVCVTAANADQIFRGGESRSGCKRWPGAYQS